MFNAYDIKKHWGSLKDQVMTKWSKLNADEVDQSKGDPKKLMTLVQNKYGMNEPFEKEFEKMCDACLASDSNTGTQSGKGAAHIPQPYKSPDMVDGWKSGQGMQTAGTKSEKNVEDVEDQEQRASENQGTDSTWGYQGVDTNTHQPDVNSGGQVNSKDTDFMNKYEPIISDRTYSEAPDEFSPNQFSRSTRETIPPGGSDSSAKNSKAFNASFNSFEDHSRSTKKL